MKKKWLEKYPVCIGCGKEWDEVTHSSKGRCRGCASLYNREKRKKEGKKPEKWAQEYDCCQNPDCPNTKDGRTSQPHNGNGFCTSCYSTWHRQENLDHYHIIEELRRMSPKLIKYMRDYNKEYYKAHKEKMIQQNTENRKNNKERYLEYQAKYREANREKCREAIRRHWHENKEVESAKRAEWRKNNPDKVKFYNRKRRAQLAGLEGTFTEDEFVEVCEAHDFCCYNCGREQSDEFLLRPDHLVPVANTIEEVISSNDIRNIGPLCVPCNSSRRNRPLFDFNPNYLEVRAQMLIDEGLEDHCVVQLYKLWQENLVCGIEEK